MTGTPDPFLDERCLGVIAASSKPLDVYSLAKQVAVEFPVQASESAHRLVAEGLVQRTRKGLVATDEGRRRAAATMAAEMDDAVAEDADALVASMASMMTVEEADLVFLDAMNQDEGNALVASFYAEHGDDIRAGLVASMNMMAPSPALVGWLATTRHALADHRKNPTLRSAVRLRDVTRKAIEAADPVALAPLDPSREQSIVAALAPRRRAQPAPAQHDACCDGLCGSPGLTGKSFT